MKNFNDKQELADALRSAISEEFEIEEEKIAPDATIKETLDLDSLSLVVRFTQHLTIQPNDGVRSNKQLIIIQLRLVRMRLRARDIIRNITGLQIGRKRLIGINGNSRKRQV